MRVIFPIVNWCGWLAMTHPSLRSADFFPHYIHHILGFPYQAVLVYGQAEVLRKVSLQSLILTGSGST